MPKAQRSRISDPQRHPLAEDYAPTSPYKTKAPKKRKSTTIDPDAAPDTLVETKASRKILALGQDLADEAEKERQAKYVSSNNAFSFDPRANFDQSDDSDDQDQGQTYDDEEAWMDEEEDPLPAEEDMNPQDLALFNKFNPDGFDDPLLHTGIDGTAEPEPTQSRNLADIILAKIAEQEAQGAFHGEEAIPDHDEVPDLDPAAVQVYTL